MSDSKVMLQLERNRGNAAVLQDAQGVLPWLDAATRCVGLFADNGIAWLSADIACVQACKPCIPLPHFFTPAQMQWALDSAGVDTLLTDAPQLPLWAELGFSAQGKTGSLTCLKRDIAAVLMPGNTAKITFTSGSTGNPKGVCLSQAAQEAVAGSIAALMRSLDVQRHLCALPLPVLLENVAGAYAAMIAGIDCVTPSLAAVGWRGSSQWDPASFLRCVVDERIESAIVLPQMLKAMLPLLSQFDTSSLRMLAVGGARVSTDLLLTARDLGLPVYEGYGLSECSSVVCFNHPGADRPGTVGQALPHANVRVNGAGELEVSGHHFEGYLGMDEPVAPDGWWPTGDLASIDSDGFVTITGRSKNLIISSFGRNISPEWVESELLAQAGILQVAVFGEGRPALSAVVFAPSLSDDALQQAMGKANQHLPDYARILHCVRSPAPFTPENGQATSNGRNKRDAILAAFRQAIEDSYSINEDTTA